MAIRSIKKTSTFAKGTNDKAERGISSSARAKASTPHQQFGGIGHKEDRSANHLSNRAKRALIHEYKGPRRRPIE